MSWNLKEALNYYQKMGAPREQNALVNLLKEIQEASGGSIPAFVPGIVAEAYGVKETFLLAIIKRIPSLRLGDGHCLELCAGPNCGKHRKLAEAAERLCKDKNITLKFVPCMRMCGKGPNVRWDGTVYNGATEQLLQTFIEKM